MFLNKIFFQTTALVLVFTNNIAEIPSCNSCQNMETVQNAHFLQMDVGKMALFFGTIAWIFFILMHTQIVHIKNSNILSNIQPDKIYVWSSIGANMKYSLQQ